MPGLQERFSLFVFSRTQVVELPGSGPFEYVVVGFVPVDAAVIEVISLEDRKSTRLNSSHNA